jgi:hypothetical protein
VHGFVREEVPERCHRFVDVDVRDDPHAAAMKFLMNDVVIEAGVVRHHAKPPRRREMAPAV